MNQISTELSQLQSDLAAMERGLAELRTKYLPHDKANFAVFGQSYVAMIRNLREQVDDLLGVAVVDDAATEAEARAGQDPAVPAPAK
jgi:hypothetical protein